MCRGRIGLIGRTFLMYHTIPYIRPIHRMAVRTISCKGGTMGKEDIGLKAYLSDARRYADLWNGGVFQGRQMIKAEELQEANPLLSKADKESVLERTRDLIMKQYYDGQRFAVFTVENQKTIDYGMPVRVMLQESLEYNKQIRKIMLENERAEQESHENKVGRVYCDAGERLYKVRKKDRLHPVATLIVYWGEEEWMGAKSLHDMIDFGDESSPMDTELKKLVPEYPLHFLDLSKLEHPEYFRTELRPLLELYKRRNNKQEFVEYIETNEAQWKMDDETWYMLSQLTHSKELKHLVEEKKDSGEETKNMCKALIDLKNEGKAEGKAEDIIELLEEYGEVPEDLRTKILGQNDLAVLEVWFKLAIKVSGVQEFIEKIQ